MLEMGRGLRSRMCIVVDAFARVCVCVCVCVCARACVHELRSVSSFHSRGLSKNGMLQERMHLNNSR